MLLYYKLVLACYNLVSEFECVLLAMISLLMSWCVSVQLYSFGETVSIVFWDDNWKPESFYDKINKNRSMGLHSLCLLGEPETSGSTAGPVSSG